MVSWPTNHGKIGATFQRTRSFALSPRNLPSFSVSHTFSFNIGTISDQSTKMGRGTLSFLTMAMRFMTEGRQVRFKPLSRTHESALISSLDEFSCDIPAARHYLSNTLDALNLFCDFFKIFYKAIRSSMNFGLKLPKWQVSGLR